MLSDLIYTGLYNRIAHSQLETEDAIIHSKPEHVSHEMEPASFQQSSFSTQPGCYSCSGLEVMSKSKAGLVNSKEKSIDFDLMN